jgi:energy-converting hydrogenase B subunit I
MDNNMGREVAVGLSFMFFGTAILYSLYGMSVLEGVNAIYLSSGNYIIPNLVSAVLFDWRSFDTLGECLILVNSVIVVGMVFGRGLFSLEFLKEAYGKKQDNNEQQKQEEEFEKTHTIDYGFTPLIKVLAMPMSIILMVLGVIVILGGHITPGGGFQGGALIAAAYILAILGFGTKNCPINFSHHYLETLETFGALTFMILGLAGMVISGSYLFNFNELFGMNIFPSPAGLDFVGIIPYLNTAVGLKVLAGLSTITFLLTGEKVILGNIKDDK